MPTFDPKDIAFYIGNSGKVVDVLSEMASMPSTDVSGIYDAADAYRKKRILEDVANRDVEIKAGDVTKKQIALAYDGSEEGLKVLKLRTYSLSLIPVLEDMEKFTGKHDEYVKDVETTRRDMAKEITQLKRKGKVTEIELQSYREQKHGAELPPLEEFDYYAFTAVEMATSGKSPSTRKPSSIWRDVELVKIGPTYEAFRDYVKSGAEIDRGSDGRPDYVTELFDDARKIFTKLKVIKVDPKYQKRPEMPGSHQEAIDDGDNGEGRE